MSQVRSERRPHTTELSLQHLNVLSASVMAFQTPSLARYPFTTQASRGQATTEPQQSAAAAAAARHQAADDREDWILFPTRPRSADTKTIFSECTDTSEDVSLISDIDGTPTASPSHIAAPNATGNEALEDDDLDALDDSLQAFHDPRIYVDPHYVDPTVSILPTHDGLGTFHQSGQAVQEHFRRFENPTAAAAAARSQGVARVRRRSSVQRRLDRVEVHDEHIHEDARNERIEKWRLEHSRVLLDEIEKETRRRMSYSSHHTNRVNKRRIADASFSQKESTAPVVDDLVLPRSSVGDSLWQRLMRRFIQSVVGIDDALLAVLFAEALPNTEEALDQVNTAGIRNDQQISRLDRKGWERRLFERLTRELDIFNPQLHGSKASVVVSPIPEDASEEDQPYAGLPIPPSSDPTVPSAGEHPHLVAEPIFASSNPNSPAFKPTLRHRHLHQPASSCSDTNHAVSWGIEDDTPSERVLHAEVQEETEYWESTPSISTIFQYIRRRYMASRAPPAMHPRQRHPQQDSSPEQRQRQPSPRSSVSTAATFHRAMMIRQLHPLIAMQTQTQPRRQSSSFPFHASSTTHLHRPPHPHPPPPPSSSSILLHRQSSLLRRPLTLSSTRSGSSAYAYPNHDHATRLASSCRSESRSVLGKRRRAGYARSGGGGSSSRNYWDVGASSVGEDLAAGGWGAV